MIEKWTDVIKDPQAAFDEIENLRAQVRELGQPWLDQGLLVGALAKLTEEVERLLRSLDQAGILQLRHPHLQRAVERARMVLAEQTSEHPLPPPVVTHGPTLFDLRTSEPADEQKVFLWNRQHRDWFWHRYKVGTRENLLRAYSHWVDAPPDPPREAGI